MELISIVVHRVHKCFSLLRITMIGEIPSSSSLSLSSIYCRIRFVNDVHEAILECAQMEAVRLEMEFGKQHPGCKSGMNGGMIAVNVPKVDKNNEDDSSRYFYVSLSPFNRDSFNMKSHVVTEWILNVILEYRMYW